MILGRPLIKVICKTSHLCYLTLLKRLLPTMSANMSASNNEMTSPRKSLLTPPEQVKGMMTLDKSKFNKTVSVPFIEFDSQHFEQILRLVKPIMLKILGLKSAINCQNKSEILLNPDLIKSFEDIDEKLKIELEKYELTTISYKDVELNYDNFNHIDIFKSVLPADQTSVSGFSMVGHILHLNLRDHIFPYKHLVAQVFLDKIKHAKLVINKLDIIESEFRNFNMEILGKSSPEVDTIVTTKENSITYQFDFAKVYWNPRLGTERERIVSKLRPKIDILYDVFAGVGPFVVPAAKLFHCNSIGNDLNPDSYKWLVHNIKINKIETLASGHNLDAREFIKTVLCRDIVTQISSAQNNNKEIPRFHVIMNLPAMAIEFLDAFKGLFTEDQLNEAKLIVHCYCFLKGKFEDPNSYLKEMFEQNLGEQLEEIQEIINIRHVAPNKDMYRISFSMPKSYLCYDNSCKRQKIE